MARYRRGLINKMIFKITFTDSNYTVVRTINDVVRAESSYNRNECCDTGCEENCVVTLADEEDKENTTLMIDVLNKFVVDGKKSDSITIEFDTTTKTATVVEK